MADGRPEIPSHHEIMRQTEEFKKRIEALVESVRPQAKMIRAAYEALVSEGFSEAQALDIIKVRGWNLGGS